MFKEHRQNIKKTEELDELLQSKKQKYYIEKNYKKIRMFNYLVWLRKNKVNLNKMFDTYIEECKQEENEK